MELVRKGVTEGLGRRETVVQRKVGVKSGERAEATVVRGRRGAEQKGRPRGILRKP